eukprot:NODE_19_length_39463_cov_0.396073.p15 type:complete len:225 gc:universal NODE_19_length_39463_cov_0.396073:21004-20330(-)
MFGNQEASPNKKNKMLYLNALKMIACAITIYLINRIRRILHKYLDGLPDPYPSLNEVYTFRQDFTFVLATISLTYSIICIIGMSVWTRKSLAQEDVEKHENGHREIQRVDSTSDSQILSIPISVDGVTTNSKIANQILLFTDFCFLLIWIISSQSYLFSIQDDYNNVVSIRSVVCKAANDAQIKNTGSWYEACENSSWLIVFNYSMCFFCLLSFGYKVVKLYNK